MRFNDLESWLYAHGWIRWTVKGSHFQYKHTHTQRRPTIAVHGREIEPDLLARVQRDLERKGA